jgi:PP-loop superfamily ATP-utilizing enzyme
MKLRKKQREHLLQLVAEGLEISEINERAAKFRPRFKVTSQQIDYYRKSRDLQLEQIKEASETAALKTGFALREIRVARLNELAEKIYQELTEETEKWWLPQVKGIGSRDNYERIDYYEFNREELESFRGLLDDIAAEVGDRLKKVDVTSGGEPVRLIVEYVDRKPKTEKNA